MTLRAVVSGADPRSSRMSAAAHDRAALLPEGEDDFGFSRTERAEIVIHAIFALQGLISYI